MAQTNSPEDSENKKYGLNSGKLLSYFDVPFPSGSFDGCLLVRGWCFNPRDPIESVFLAIPGTMTWSATYSLERPDVAAAIADCPTPHCGFELCIKLPAGTYPARLEARHASGTVETVASTTLLVSRWKRLNYLLAAPPERLLRFQMLAGPSYPPRALTGHNMRLSRSSAYRDTSPTFSIVTPSFNQAAYLEETMRSVIQQRDVRVAYVVQDGGSSDGTQDIIKRVAGNATPAYGETSRNEVLQPAKAEERREINRDRPDMPVGGAEGNLVDPRPGTIHVAWETAPDRGQADAIIRGFAKTSGKSDDLMGWLNSDDFYLRGALAYVADYFARHPEIDAVYSHRVLIDAQSREVGRWYLPAHDDDVLKLYDFIPQETLFWRRKLWETTGGLNPAFQFAMDWDLLLRFVDAGAKIVRLPRPLACFRLHPEQKTSNRIRSIGQMEIDELRTRANRRVISPAELERHPRLKSYLRRSSLIEWRRELCACFPGR